MQFQFREQDRSNELQRQSPNEPISHHFLVVGLFDTATCRFACVVGARTGSVVQLCLLSIVFDAFVSFWKALFLRRGRRHVDGFVRVCGGLAQ